MHSIWQEINLPEFPQLKEDIHTDVLIIGGGIAGILTAYLLHQEGKISSHREGENLLGNNPEYHGENHGPARPYLS